MKEKKLKIKLNHKCVYCNKEIFLGERVIFNPKPFHLDCAVDKLISYISISTYKRPLSEETWAFVNGFKKEIDEVFERN